jgi:4,5-DOPA dioxygenase extradiol
LAGKPPGRGQGKHEKRDNLAFPLGNSGLECCQMNFKNLTHGLAALPDSETQMPALFVGHGSPTNAIEDNEFSRAWAAVGKGLAKPAAVLCISAHWQTDGTQVTAMPNPRTIHDFYGFPEELHQVQYPAPGSSDLAQAVQDIVQRTSVRPDQAWGLDHGAWSVLRRMFPKADVPVVQLSLDRAREPAYHFELGQELGVLRRKGVLILGSGNIVHNLGRVVWQDQAYDWAVAFDEQIAHMIQAEDHQGIVNYAKLGEIARLSVPTNEHFLPLLYALGARNQGDTARFFAEKVTLGSISMRALQVGSA